MLEDLQPWELGNKPATDLVCAVPETTLSDRINTFFDTTLPDVLTGVEGQMNRAKVWRTALFDAGLAGIDYPVELGGQGLDDKAQALYTELSAGRVPPENALFGIGTGMALPVVRDHGTAELKAAVVRNGLSGDEIWCQLYSEPGAGSDLASLSTKATLDGDEWVVSGQKVWTSGAEHSQQAILLARTNPDAPKHRGITMFVLPMEQQGITVRPLRQMTGDSEFNEVFIDEARLPKDWVVGDVNDGWRMAVALLAHERVQTGVASMTGAAGTRSRNGRVPIPVQDLIDLARDKRQLDDALVRQDLARLHTGAEIVRYLREQGTHPSIGKLWRTRQGRACAQLAAALSFPAGPAWVEGNIDDAWFSFQILNCRGMSLGGGTDEIQRNTLGERALGLPREPSIDKEVPFRDLLVGTQPPSR